MPSDYQISMACRCQYPHEVERAHMPLKGHVTDSKIFLKFGVHFPLYQCFRNIINFYGLTVFQVTPNGWVHMIGLFILFTEKKMDPPSPKKFSWFYTLKLSKGDLGFYYFCQASDQGS